LNSAPIGDVYAVNSLATERPMLVLTIDLDRLTAAWRADGDERYPHVYGPIDRAAIIDVRAIARTADGTFLPIDGGAARFESPAHE
jgi:uncharacterized protein (DUF952 family)